MEATIVQVMESWPLQLALQTADEVVHVMLAEKVSIMRKGLAVDPGALHPGQKIRVLSRTPQGSVLALEILE
jgi:hypothetical protein